jgi:hypothetical protein
MSSSKQAGLELEGRGPSHISPPSPLTAREPEGEVENASSSIITNVNTLTTQPEKYFYLRGQYHASTNR